MAKQGLHLRQWWLSLINAIVFFLLGLWIFVGQITLYADIKVVLAIGFFIVGGLRIYYALVNRDELRYWSMLLLNGIIEFCVFLIPLFFSSKLESNLPVYVGFILLFRTILGAGIGVDFYYSHLSSWFFTFLFSIAGLVASFLMIWNPISSGSSVLVYPALTFIFVGLSQTGIALGLKKLNYKLE